MTVYIIAENYHQAEQYAHEGREAYGFDVRVVYSLAKMRGLRTQANDLFLFCGTYGKREDLVSILQQVGILRAIDGGYVGHWASTFMRPNIHPAWWKLTGDRASAPRSEDAPGQQLQGQDLA